MTVTKMDLSSGNLDPMTQDVPYMYLFQFVNSKLRAPVSEEDLLVTLHIM